ncbi:restriction endonuclease subunit S [Escherichia coli]|nr:restriction endonuclease subunit S [Escherichia coli]
MSELSYLEKLMDGVEVEWKAVGDIAGYSTTKVDADKLDATSFVGVDNLLADKGGRIDATYQPNTARLTAYEPGDILLGNIRPYLKKVWMAENNGGCSGDVLAIRILADCKKIISPEYLYYALSSDSFFSYSMQHAKGAKMPRGSKDAILNYQIPIPCPSAPEKSLAIQSEIVRILDKFTALTAELTAELNMRKKQYNYYRDQLLSFDEEQEKPIYLEKLMDGVEVEWRTLGEIAVIYDGTHKTPKYTASGVPFVSVQNIKNLYGTNKYISPEDFKTYKNKPRKHDLFMTRIGDVGTCAIVEDDRPLAYYVTLALIRINQQIAVPGFIRYLIESRFGKAELYKRTLIHAVPMKINLGEIGKVAVPIPCPDNPEKSLAIQSEIVRILDKFDTLTNSITEGLPREIELRQKQYEYYRNLLFSFPKPETVSN